MVSQSEPENVRQYLEGVDYPADTRALYSAARSNDAPSGVINLLNQLPSDAKFSDPEEVAEELENIEQSGKQTPPQEIE